MGRAPIQPFGNDSSLGCSRLTHHHDKSPPGRTAVKFAIPYTYPVQYVVHRRRTVQTAIVTSTVVVEIEEVFVPEGPAFVLGHDGVLDESTNWRRFPLIEGKPAKAWRVDRQLMVQYCSVDSFVARVSSSDDNPFDVTASGVSAIPIPSQERNLITSYEEVSRGTVLRSWEDDAGVGKAERISMRATEMRIIDGYVCAPVSEPVLMVHRPRYGVVVLAISEGSDLAAFGRRFRLECVEEAERYASEERYARRQGQIVIATFAEDRVFFPQEAEHLYQDAQNLLRMLSGEVGWLNSEVVDACATLREVLAHCPPGHVVPALTPTLRTLLLKVRGMPRPPSHLRTRQARYEKRYRPYLDRHCSTIEATISKWQNRPFTEEEWCDAALHVPMVSGVYQVLSRFQLVSVCRRMRIAPNRLMEAHRRGRIIVHHKGVGRGGFVSVISGSLDIEEVIGDHGYRLPVGEETELVSKFILHNGRNSTDADSLSNLNF
jgi:hypothetical protein